MKTIGILTLLIMCTGCGPYPEDGESSASSGGLVEDAVCTSSHEFIQLHPDNNVHFGLHASARASMHTEATCLSGIVCEAQARVFGSHGPMPVTLGWWDQNRIGDEAGLHSRGCDGGPEDAANPYCILGFRASPEYHAEVPEWGILISPECGKCICEPRF